VARHGYALSVNGSQVGQVTSGTFSPSLERGIGMGYVAAAHAETGRTVNVLIRGTEVPASIVKIPFLQKP
jgi:aminomethyltransferase